MLTKRISLFLLFLVYSIGFIFLIWNKRLLLFLHPDFLPLAYFAMIFLLLIALALLFSKLHHHHLVTARWWKWLLMLLPLLAIFFFELKPLSSSAALDRGINTGSLTIGRRASVGQFATKPENRTLYQWVIALNADPEPSHYDGQKVRVRGFVLRDESLPIGQIAIAKFILTCCAADARVLSLPVQELDSILTTLANDEWVEVEGQMNVLENNGQRSLVVVPSKVTPISIPENPYEI